MDLRLASGSAFEVVAELAAFTSGPARASLESGKPWIREVRGLAGKDLIRQVERWSLSMYGELASIVLDAGPPYETDQLVARLRVTPADLLVRRLLGAESLPNRSMLSSDAFERAIAGERAARSEVRRVLGLQPQARQSIVRLLRTPARSVQREVAATVEAWAAKVHPAFADRSAALIARDVEAKTRLFADVSVRDAIMAATNGVDYDPSAWASEIVVVPTVALRPFLGPVEWGRTAILLCSVGDAAYDDDPAAPPRRLVKAAGALGDELRLRILHELGAGDATATQLASRLKVDRTSLHHHLGILRSAGLVGARAAGFHSWRYTLRADGVTGASAILMAYLAPRPAAARRTRGASRGESTDG